MHLGDRVRTARKAKKLTQKDLVAAVKKRGGDLSQPQLSAIEKGEVERPGSLLELAAALDVAPADLLGKAIALKPAPHTGLVLPVSTVVAAGDEILQPHDGDGPMEYTGAPPGMTDGEVTEVRGRSMLPIFRDGDRLFHRFVTEDPLRLIGEVVVARLKDGRRFVKILKLGRRKGRFDLESINQQFPPMENEAVAAVAEILWVERRSKRASLPATKK